MHRIDPGQRSVWTVMITLALAFGTVPARSADPSVEDLAARLRETLTGLHTIEASFLRTVRNDEGGVFVNECHWLSDGGRFKFVADPNTSGAGLSNAWISFDGRTGHTVTRKGDFPKQITKVSGIPEQFRSVSTPSRWLGLTLNETDGTILDLLESGKASVIAAESWNGLPAYRVDLGTHETRLAGPWRYTALLCPDRGGLPVEIECRLGDQHPSAEKRGLIAATLYTVTEFEPVSDQTLGVQHWFPWKMQRSDHRVTQTLEMTEVRINGPVSKSAFTPPAPQPGTWVVDESVPGRRTERMYEDKKWLAERAPALTQEIQTNIRSAADPKGAAVARRPGAGWLSRTAPWLGAGALVLAGALYAVRSLRTT